MAPNAAELCEIKHNDNQCAFPGLSRSFIIIYFISISKTNEYNKEPEQPIDMRMKKDKKAKV